ncbi:hypothetical protein SLS58_005518 [Diplodia intermedia]|uniref:Uncharacterized protein n=1 Tax=Diplodia intermedia TaxID=856260 RepID=A0ABR3TRF7_9PEZI
MDFNSILHAYNKIMADRATSNTTVRSDNQHDTPPAYSTLTTAAPTADSDMGYDTDSEVEDDDLASASANPGNTIAINASTIIQGSNNIIAVPPIDGPRLTSILLSLLHGTLPTQIQAQQQQQQQQQGQLAAHGSSPAGTAAAPQQHLPGHLPGDDSSKRSLPNIRVDCGMRIVGDRNVVGGLPPSLRTVSPASAAIQQQQQQQQSGGGGTATKRGDGGRDEVGAGGMPTPPETPLSLTGGEAGSKKRKAGENEAEAEAEAETGGREAKRERVDGAEGRV